MRKRFRRRDPYGRRLPGRMAAVIIARLSEEAGPVVMPEIREAVSSEGYNGHGRYLRRVLSSLVDRKILARIDRGRRYQLLPPTDWGEEVGNPGVASPDPTPS